jgi:hypothetical protein
VSRAALEGKIFILRTWADARHLDVDNPRSLVTEGEPGFLAVDGLAVNNGESPAFTTSDILSEPARLEAILNALNRLKPLTNPAYQERSGLKRSGLTVLPKSESEFGVGWLVLWDYLGA